MAQDKFEYTLSKNKFYFDVHGLEISNWIYTDDEEDTSKRNPQPISFGLDALVIFDAQQNQTAEITPSHKLYHHFCVIILDLIQYDYDFIKAKLGE
jgi:hypothetical protein